MTGRRRRAKREREPGSARAALDASMLEDDLQAGVEGALAAGGWLYHHDLPAERLGQIANYHSGQPGWPDIVAVHPERRQLLVLELKSASGRFEPGQKDWLYGWRKVGADVRVVRPEDYEALIDELVGDRLLARPRRRRTP